MEKAPSKLCQKRGKINLTYEKRKNRKGTHRIAQAERFYKVNIGQFQL
jgi:hypothetical protein